MKQRLAFREEHSPKDQHKKMHFVTLVVWEWVEKSLSAGLSGHPPVLCLSFIITVICFEAARSPLGTPLWYLTQNIRSVLHKQKLSSFIYSFCVWLNKTCVVQLSPCSWYGFLNFFFKVTFDLGQDQNQMLS